MLGKPDEAILIPNATELMDDPAYRRAVITLVELCLKQRRGGRQPAVDKETTNE